MERKRYIAEFLGTALLVFFGAGAIVINEISEGSITHGGIALAFGLVVLLMIYSFGKISGAHINPAVTLAFWYSGHIERRLVLPYILSQFAGAVAGCLILFLLFPSQNSYGLTLPFGSVFQSFALEILLSFVLMLVIIMVVTGDSSLSNWAGLIIGGTVMLLALVGGPISGASMNPARSFGPALISANWSHIWIYLTAPVIGAIPAVWVCRSAREEGCCKPKSRVKC